MTGLAAELKAEVGSPTLFIFVDEAQAEKAQAILATFGDLRPSPEGTLGVGLTDGPGAVSNVVRQLDDAGIMVRNLELREPSLDDVFAEATGHRLEGASS